MERNIEADKGIEVYSVVSLVEDKVSEMLNEEFEDVNANLKSKTKITIKIEKVE